MAKRVINVANNTFWLFVIPLQWITLTPRYLASYECVLHVHSGCILIILIGLKIYMFLNER